MSEKKRIVILTSSDLEKWFDGVSLIIRNFIKNLPDDVECDIWSFGDTSNFKSLYPKHSFREIILPNQPRLNWILRFLGINNFTEKYKSLNKDLEFSCATTEAIYLFDSAHSPLTSWILNYWPSKTILHLTDCSTLHSGRFRKIKPFIRSFLMEWRVARYSVNRIIFVSSYDAAFFRRFTYPKSPVISLPLGVDTDQFAPICRSEKIKQSPFTLLFTGVLSYAPNAEAALFLARDLLPLLPQDMNLIIAGIEPKEELYALAAKDKRLKITGAIEKIEKIYHEADLFIAPMFSGAGMQNKILQALASGLAVITTPICALAFNELCKSIIVCPDIKSMISCIIKFKDDANYRSILSNEARNYAVNEFSWINRTYALLDIAGIK